MPFSPTYRCKLIAPDGKEAIVHLVFTSDSDAILAANTLRQEFGSCCAAEVWDGDRLVYAQTDARDAAA
ncbi:MAG: hypothetical protein AB7V53_05720 [Dongiaceae bacterium]